jgi:hypothetical protein
MSSAQFDVVGEAADLIDDLVLILDGHLFFVVDGNDILSRHGLLSAPLLRWSYFIFVSDQSYLS